MSVVRDLFDQASTNVRDEPLALHLDGWICDVGRVRGSAMLAEVELDTLGGGRSERCEESDCENCQLL